jgi:nucleotide-binding universal stress UspA family protein
VLDAASNHGIPTQVMVDNGDTWMVMSDFMKNYTVDLLVIGTTGRTGLGKVLLG